MDSFQHRNTIASAEVEHIAEIRAFLFLQEGQS